MPRERATTVFPPPSPPPSAPGHAVFLDGVLFAPPRVSAAAAAAAASSPPPLARATRELRAFVRAETLAVTQAAARLEHSAPFAEASALGRWTDAADALAERATCAWDLLALAEDAAATAAATTADALAAEKVGHHLDNLDDVDGGSLTTVSSDGDMFDAARPGSPRCPLGDGVTRVRHASATCPDDEWKTSGLFAGAFAAFDAAVLALSRAYAAIRNASSDATSDANSAASARDAVWTPPTTFERRTTKYWIRPRDVLRVKLATCKHLPVLVFGGRDGKAASAERGGAQNPRGDVGPVDGCLVSSVYFDDDELDVYRTRMERLEGATLVRVRWYDDGSPTKDPSPTKDLSPFVAVDDDEHGPSRVYVERKTHHESWSQESSVKERFRLDARDLRSYLAGGAAAKSQTRDQTLDQTLDAESATLAKEIAEDQLFARGLTPSVGTRYRRTAFQRADTNDVRVSLDVDLVFTDARNCSYPRDCSCPRDDSRRAPVRFPCAILEVKLARTDGDDAGGTPDWIEDVLATGRATEVKKFSKFLHATAAFRVDHGGVDAALPHWYGAETAAAAAADDDDDDETVTVTAAEIRTVAPLARSADHVCVAVDDEGCEPPRPLAGLSGGAGAPTPVPSPANLKSRDAPRVSAAAARRRYVPVKVEPKTFFANERTMLQWLSMSILILFMSLALLSLDGGGYRGTADPVIGVASSSLGTPVGTPVGTPRAAVASGVCGAILAPVAVAFMAYSLWMYLWRARRIARREPSARYDDRWGPVVLVVMLMGISCAAVVLAVVSRPW